MDTNENLQNALTPIIKKGVRDELESIMSEMKSQTSPEYLDIEEAAQFTKLKVNTIYQKVCKNTIPNIHVGRKVIFKKSDLINWIENQKTQKS